MSRCRLSDSEATAVDIFPINFSGGVTLEALTPHRTSTEIENTQFGSGGGSVYLAVLEQIMKAEGLGTLTPSMPKRM